MDPDLGRYGGSARTARTARAARSCCVNHGRDGPTIRWGNWFGYAAGGFWIRSLRLVARRPGGGIRSTDCDEYRDLRGAQAVCGWTTRRIVTVRRVYNDQGVN